MDDKGDSWMKANNTKLTMLTDAEGGGGDGNGDGVCQPGETCIEVAK